MISKCRTNPILVYVALASAMLAGVSAEGHDPLDDVQHNAAQHNDYYQASTQSVDLADIRSMVIKFRETGDDRQLDEAWKILQPSIEAGSADPQILLVASFVAQSRHNFEYALRLINDVLMINAGLDEAWLLLASIHLVRGELESASQACHQLRNATVLVMLTCSGRIALARGNHQVAYERLGQVLKLTHSQRFPPDLLAWSYSIAGDLGHASGDNKQAKEFYRKSLTLAERTQVRAALVDVLLLEKKYRQAAHVLEHGSLALPLLVRRLIVAKHLGYADDLKDVSANVRQEFEQWIADEDWLHAREMARFYIDVVDQPELARRLAIINFDLQKEPEDLRLITRTQLTPVFHDEAV